jgi:3-oxoacyl-[acyl-carrier protein] reductase
MPDPIKPGPVKPDLINPDPIKRNVVVTGGSRGLGLAIARRLAAAGYGVVAIARKMSGQLSGAMQENRSSGAGSLDFVAFDLGDTQGIPKLARTLRQQFGSVYGLVNNAALGTDGLLANMKNSQIEELLRVNTLAPIMLSKYVVRAMMADGGGRIVNVTSIIGFTGYSGLSVYGATKASMIGFTRSLAREVGRLGINVNAVAPGFLDTEMTQGLAGEQCLQVARRSALRRLVDVEDVADAVEFLMGDKAKSITGTVLTVDAGSTA